MADDQLSPKEAALLAQVRAEMAQRPPAATSKVARVPERPTRVDVHPDEKRPAGAAPVVQVAPSIDPATRIVALIAAERSASEQRRRRQQRAYVLIPLAIVIAMGLWVLAWFWRGI